MRWSWASVDPRFRGCEERAQGERRPGSVSSTPDSSLATGRVPRMEATGIGMVVFDSQESAEAASGPIRAGATEQA